MAIKLATGQTIDQQASLILGAPLDIPNAATRSAGVNNLGMGLCGIFCPTGFQGTTITFETTFDGTNYVVVNSTAGTPLSITVVANEYTAVDPTPFQGLANFRLVTTAQTADTICLISLKG